VWFHEPFALSFDGIGGQSRALGQLVRVDAFLICVTLNRERSRMD
jgi:hypothetical protein